MPKRRDNSSLPCEYCQSLPPGQSQQLSGLPLWVDYKDGKRVFQFNVFNADPNVVRDKMLVSILRAQVSDFNRNWAPYYGSTVSFKLYPGSAMNKEKLFMGDRLPLWLGPYGPIPSSNPQNGYTSASVSDGSVGSPPSFYGIPVIPSNFPANTPFGIVYTNKIVNSYASPLNPYGISPITLPRRTYYHQLSYQINVVLKSILGNDMGSTLRSVFADQSMLTMTNWHYAEFKDPINPAKCTNSTYDLDTGFYTLPLLNEVFPQMLGKGPNYIFVDYFSASAVSSPLTNLETGYWVKGWQMSNFTHPNFALPYNTHPTLTYDKAERAILGLTPYGGSIPYVIMVDINGSPILERKPGGVYQFRVTNYGQVTAEMRLAPPENNFPPDYTLAFIVDTYVEPPQ